MAKTIAALGFKVHTGWVTCVAMTGPPERLEVLVRLRPELLPDDGSIPRFVFHEAAQLDAAAASDLLRRAEQAAHALADAAVGELIDELGSHNAIARACGVVVASKQHRAGTELAAILRTHPLIHAAEGILFQEAICAACQGRGLRVTTVPERDVWAAAAQASHCAADVLRKHVDALRRSVGAPWTAAEKSAAAAAIAAGANYLPLNLV